MKETTTLDRARRGVFPPGFKRGDVFKRVVESANQVTFIRLQPGATSPGTMKRSGGRWMLDVRPVPAAVQAALRADRDV